MWLESLTARVLFLPTLAYIVVLDKVTPYKWYSHIDDHVFLGALPLKSMTSEIVNDLNVKAVVSLNEDYELRHRANNQSDWKKLGIDSIQFQVVEYFEPPSQEVLIKGVKFINDNIGKGNIVYVHCKAGRSRSATMVASYLMQKHQWIPEEAYAYVKSKRPQVHLGPGKMKALQLFYENQVMTNNI